MAVRYEPNQPPSLTRVQCAPSGGRPAKGLTCAREGELELREVLVRRGVFVHVHPSRVVSASFNQQIYVFS